MKITVEYVIYMNSYKRGEGGGREQVLQKNGWNGTINV